MRRRRIKVLSRSAVYHCMSRVAGGEFLLGDLEKEMFRKMMWQQARFSGNQIITNSVMGNHFHILLRVLPPAPDLSDKVIADRTLKFYRKHHPLATEANRVFKETGRLPADMRKRLLARMGDLSVFMKELKQRFTIWYNATHDRYGTFWAQRFKSVLVQDSPGVLRMVAGYIDLNAVRAGLVKDPKDYRFCGYGEAVAGGQEARKGLSSMEANKSWAEISSEYRKFLCIKAGAGKKGVLMERKDILKTLKKGGKLPVGEVLRLRIRYMNDGVVLGSKGFVNEVFQEFRDRFGARRKTGARAIRGMGLDGMSTMRDLQVDVVSSGQGGR